MTWNWGSQGQGGPGGSAGATGVGANGNRGAGGSAPYRPPQPAAQLDLDGRPSQLPPWMTSTAGVAMAYRSYNDDEAGAGGGAIA